MRIWLLSAILLLAVPQTTRDRAVDRLSKVERFAFGPTDMGESSRPVKTITRP
jgi:hypothetical protein